MRTFTSLVVGNGLKNDCRYEFLLVFFNFFYILFQYSYEMRL
jgi:hypothetical protein